MLVHLVRTLWVGVFVYVVVKAAVTPYRHSVYPEYALAACEWPADGEFASIVSIQYLPYFGDLLAAFAVLPDRLGAAVWGAVIVAAYAGGLRAYLTVDPPGGGVAWQVALAVGLLVGCGSPANLQANVLIVACYLWAAVAVRGRWWWTAAVLFALPMFKLYTLAPGLVFAALYPRQLGLRLAVAVAGLLALPYVSHPAAAVGHRYHTLLAYLTGGDHYELFSYQTLYEAWRRYVGGVNAKWLLPVQAAAGLAVPLVLWKLRKGGAAAADVERNGLFLTLTWCVSFGPSIEPQTYLLAAPAVGWWLARCSFGPRPHCGAAVALLLVAAVAGSPLFAVPAVRTALIPARVPFFALAAVHVGMLYVVRVRSRAIRGAAAVMPTTVLKANGVT